MSPTLHLRKGRKDEIDDLVQLSIRAFRGRPLSEALFPEHLQTAPGEELGFRARGHLSKMDHKDLHYVVVADEEDKAVGCAVWQSPLDPSASPEDLEAAKATLRANLPKGLDVAALAEVDKAVQILEGNLRDALGEDGYKNAWCKFKSPVVPISSFCERLLIREI